MAGRPREFSNAAEKQKAYRERKKAAIAEQEALRNAPPTPDTVEYWRKKKDESESRHSKLISRSPLEAEYDQWCKDIAHNLALWNEATTAIYLIENPKAKEFYREYTKNPS